MMIDSACGVPYFAWLRMQNSRVTSTNGASSPGLRSGAFASLVTFLLLGPASVAERLEAASPSDGSKPAVSMAEMNRSSTHLMSPDLALILPSNIPLVFRCMSRNSEKPLWNDSHAAGLTLTPKLLQHGRKELAEEVAEDLGEEPQELSLIHI